MAYQLKGSDGKTYKVEAASPQDAATKVEQAIAQKGQLNELSALTQKPSIAAGAREQYDAMPGWKRAATTLVDLPGLIANGATFGNLDEGAAWAGSKLRGTNYEDELRKLNQQTEDARARQGYVGTGAEILGSIGTGGAAAKAVGAGVGYVAPNVARAFTAVAPTASKAKKAVNYALRTGMAGAEGAAQGAATAHGEGEDVGQGAIAGGLFGAAAKPFTDLVSGGVSKVAGMFNPKEAVPTLKKINTAKNAAYDIAERAGVIIKPEGLKHLNDTMIADISDFGYEAQQHGGAKILVDRIMKEAAAGQPMTLKGLDGIRKLAGNVGYQTGLAPGVKANNAIITKIVDHIDDLLKQGDPAHMAGIDTAGGVKALEAGRKLAQRGFKLDAAQKLIKRGEQQAANNVTDTATKSVKTQVRNFIDPFKSWGRGFTEAEKAAAEKAAAYTQPQRALHGLSVLNPLSGGKLSSSLNLGLGIGSFAAAGPLGVLAQQAGSGVIGYAAGKGSEYLAKKSVKSFLDTIARGGVPAPVVENAIQKMAKSKQDAVRRAIMQGLNIAGHENIPGMSYIPGLSQQER